jgi:hypothetical protein
MTRAVINLNIFRFPYGKKKCYWKNKLINEYEKRKGNKLYRYEIDYKNKKLIEVDNVGSETHVFYEPHTYEQFIEFRNEDICYGGEDFLSSLYRDTTMLEILDEYIEQINKECEDHDLKIFDIPDNINFYLATSEYDCNCERQYLCEEHDTWREWW